MNNLRDKKSNPVITLIVVVISLFFLPAIAAGLGLWEKFTLMVCVNYRLLV